MIGKIIFIIMICFVTIILCLLGGLVLLVINLSAMDRIFRENKHD
jgi:hypothetical protein